MKTRLSRLNAGAGLLALALGGGAAAPASAAPAAGRQQAAPAAAQPEDLARGRALLAAHDVKGAARVFREATARRPGDADAWYFLGVALGRDFDTRGARKAFETAVKLRPDFARAHAGLAIILLQADKHKDAEQSANHALTLDADTGEAHYALAVLRLWRDDSEAALESAEAALKINPNLAGPHLVRAQALVSYGSGRRRPPAGELSKEEGKKRRLAFAERLRQAAESLEKYLQLSPTVKDAELWRQQLEALRFHSQYAEEGPSGAARALYSGVDDDDPHFQRAVILSKPEPGVTEEARRNHASGRIRLRVVLAEDGTVKHPLVLRGLPHGLTEKAISAALRIKFQPAQRAGQPVAQYVTLEYGFNFY
jgi:TonB family protein